MELKNFRAKIDECDLDLLKVISERATLALEIGKQKAKAGRPVIDKNREESVLSKLIEKNPGPLPDESIQKIFQVIIEQNRALQENNIPK